jgi:hypothetical protein
MVSHRILDEVLAAWSHVAILRVLQDIAQGLTGREIARQAGISHQACDRALARLENLHINFAQPCINMPANPVFCKYTRQLRWPMLYQSNWVECVAVAKIIMKRSSYWMSWLLRRI